MKNFIENRPASEINNNNCITNEKIRAKSSFLPRRQNPRPATSAKTKRPATAPVKVTLHLLRDKTDKMQVNKRTISPDLVSSDTTEADYKNQIRLFEESIQHYKYNQGDS